MNERTRSAGFTLIEILVAIAIIGILSSILFVSFGDARNNAANKAMMAEFKEVQLALELYRAQIGAYPLPGCGASGPILSAEDVADCGGTTDYISSIVPTFFAALPRAADSNNGNCEIEYRTDATGSWYKLTAIDCIAGSQQLTQNDEMARCPSSCSSAGRCDTGQSGTPAFFPTSFAIYSLGGQCE